MVWVQLLSYLNSCTRFLLFPKDDWFLHCSGLPSAPKIYCLSVIYHILSLNPEATAFEKVHTRSIFSAPLISLLLLPSISLCFLFLPAKPNLNHLLFYGFSRFIHSSILLMRLTTSIYFWVPDESVIPLIICHSVIQLCSHSFSP